MSRILHRTMEQVEHELDEISLKKANKNNIVENWLEQHGNPKICKEVKCKLEHITIEKYCKYFGYKFEKHIKNGFVTSKKVKLFAGMEKNLITGNIKSMNIKCVGFKTVYEKHLCFEDGDIIGNGYVNDVI